MTRKDARELAFIILFENAVTKNPTNEIISAAKESRDIETDEFSMELVVGTEKYMEDIDSVIGSNIRGWHISRLSKVAISILRLAVFELKYEEKIPVSVSINEAVELAKKYGGSDDAPYVNGVLSSVAKNPENLCEKKQK